MAALGAVIGSGVPLTRYRLQRIVDAREEVSGRAQQPADVQALLGRCDAAHGQLLSLELEATGDSSPAAAAAARSLGRALGLVDVLRAVVPEAAKGRTQIPADLVARHDLSLDGLARGMPSEELSSVARELAGLAKENLVAARRAAAEIAADSRSLFLPAVGTGLWLDMLGKEGYNLFEGRLQHPPGTPLGYQLRLHWARLRKTY